MSKFMTRQPSPARAFVLLASIALVLGGCAAEKKVDRAALKSDIEAANRRFSDAFARKDASAIGQLYAGDAQALPPGAAPVEGRTAIEEMWKGFLGLPIAQIQLETLDVDGNDATAWETGRYTIVGNDGSTVDAGKYTVVWKHEESGWKLYRDMWSSNSPPQPPAAQAPPRKK